MFWPTHSDETAEPKDRKMIINTQPHLLQHEKGICKKIWFSLREHRKRVGKYNTTQPCESMQLHCFMESSKE